MPIFREEMEPFLRLTVQSSPGPANSESRNVDVTNDPGCHIVDGIISKQSISKPSSIRPTDTIGTIIAPDGTDPTSHTSALKKFEGKNNRGTKTVHAFGTTATVDTVMPAKGQSLVKAFEDWRKNADDKLFCDYVIHVTVSHPQDTPKKAVASHETEEAKSFKMLLTYNGTKMLDDYDLYRAFRLCKGIGALPSVSDKDCFYSTQGRFYSVLITCSHN